jgi:hypothetical protein
MALELSARHEWVMQSEIRNKSIECDKVCGINLLKGLRYGGASDVRDGLAGHGCGIILKLITRD